MKLKENIKIENISIYTDGACSGNPGPGGWGAIVGWQAQSLSQVIELGDGVRSTTNNKMELTATIKSIEYINKNLEADQISAQLKKVNLYTDSVYVIRGITQWIFGWKRNGWKNSSGENVNNQDLWQELDMQVRKLNEKLSLKIEWQYVRGHKGILGNERCDEIAVAYSKNTTVYLYEGDGTQYNFDFFKKPLVEPLPESSWDSSKKSNTPSWYLVYKNGVLQKYTTWKECEGAVKGVPGVKFKKVSSEQEQDEVLKGWGYQK